MTHLVPQKSRAAWRRRLRRPLDVEPLEQRHCLAAATGGGWHLSWNGATVEARQDAWVVRSAAPLGAADLIGGLGWRATPLGEGFTKLDAPGVTADDVVAWAARTPGVSAVEPDILITSRQLPTDSAFGSLWGLHNVGQSGGTADADIDAPEAWDVTTGSRSVVVAVIDSGFDYTHPDLATNAWRNPGEIAGDGIDNDGNGFVDDVHGWDFANDDADPMDDDGHGTHVAGTIGAVGNNATGVTGVNWQVSIMGLKFLDASGSGSTSDAVAALTYATRMRRDFGINVVATNNSWGGADHSNSLRSAIAAAGRAGILFVTAAGNDHSDNDRFADYPSTYRDEAVISVTATDRSNRLAVFANYGATSVDLAAPGVAIRSTVPGGYATFSGTSMAAPFVTGTVALLAAANPQATAAEIRSAILATAKPITALAGRVASGGLLNAASAVQAIRRLSSAAVPASIAAVPLSQDVDDGKARAYAVTASPSSAVRFASRIGDGPFGRRDVDIFRVTLAAGQVLTIDIDARSLTRSSTLDSHVRLFNAAGKQRAANDDAGGSLDSHLMFTAPSAGTYSIGVSGSGNSAYSVKRAGSGRVGSTGNYEITFSFG